MEFVMQLLKSSGKYYKQYHIGVNISRNWLSENVKLYNLNFWHPVNKSNSKCRDYDLWILIIIILGLKGHKYTKPGESKFNSKDFK